MSKLCFPLHFTSIHAPPLLPLSIIHLHHPPLLPSLLSPSPLPLPSHLIISHNAQLAKPLQHIGIDSAEPLLLEALLAATLCDGVFQVVAHEGDEVEPVDGVRVEEDALAGVLGGLGLDGREGVGFVGPVEGAATCVSK